GSEDRLWSFPLRHDHVHPGPGGHRADPLHRREYQLQRVPVPGQLRGRGRVPARWLTKRGHRLVFSNGIIVLAVLSCALLAGAGANVNSLVPFYAIGVFTAFTMAGFGMA